MRAPRARQHQRRAPAAGPARRADPSQRPQRRHGDAADAPHQREGGVAGDQHASRRSARRARSASSCRCRRRPRPRRRRIGQISGVSMSSGSSAQPSTVGRRRSRAAPCAADEPLGQQAERHLQGDVAGDHHRKQRRHARLRRCRSWCRRPAAAHSMPCSKPAATTTANSSSQAQRHEADRPKRCSPASPSMSGRLWQHERQAERRRSRKPTMPTRNGGQPSRADQAAGTAARRQSRPKSASCRCP